MLSVGILLQPLHQILVLVFSKGNVVAELLLGSLKTSISVDPCDFGTGVVKISILAVEIDKRRDSQVMSPVVFSKIWIRE